MTTQPRQLTGEDLFLALGGAIEAIPGLARPELLLPLALRGRALALLPADLTARERERAMGEFLARSLVAARPGEGATPGEVRPC